MVPKTVVIGGCGFIGSHFLRSYRSFYKDTVGTHHTEKDGFALFNLNAPELNVENLKTQGYTYALIACAHANLMLCEKDPSSTFKKNVESVLDLAKSLARWGITPILFSTDYVFDGKEGGYSEDSQRNPLNEYGKQKAELEKRLPQVCGENYLLLRLSKVFGLEKGDNTLIDQMATCFMNRQQVKAAKDQIFCPILIEDVVQAVLQLQIQGCRGIFNLCGTEIWSRLELAQELSPANHLIEEITLDDLDEIFVRPKRTDMSCKKLLETINIKMTPVSQCIQVYKENYYGLS